MKKALLLVCIATCGCARAGSEHARSADSTSLKADSFVVSAPPGTFGADFLGVAMTPWARARGEPRFADYSASDTQFTRQPSPVDFRSAPGAGRWRSVLTAGAARGPNFAGHFTVIDWRRGAGVWQFAVVDALSGRVAFLPPDTLSYDAPPVFRRDSRLIVLDPTPRVTDAHGCPVEAEILYLEWANGRLVPIDTIDASRACPRPPSN